LAHSIAHSPVAKLAQQTIELLAPGLSLKHLTAH
jgi:hypothetical protein